MLPRRCHVQSSRAITQVAPDLEMTPPTPPNLARIPAGDFMMGAADAEEDQRPAHRVTLSDFLISRFQVTHDEYARFVRATGHPPPSVRELPLITAGGRDAVFPELAAP